jgi:hypothetical protein
MKIDAITITILEDGTIRMETDEVGQANHLSAEKFLETVSRLAGGETETVRKPQAHSHSHHGKTHVHSH